MEMKRNQPQPSTQQSLKDAFIDLYILKPLRKISINELAAAAHISRGTFYLYFADIQSLLESIENEFIAGVMNLNASVLLTALKRNPDVSSYTLPYSQMLDYILENQKVFRALLTGSESLQFRQKYLSNIQKSVMTMFEIDKRTPREYWELSCAFHAGGVISLFESWMNDMYRQDPVEVASIVYKALFIGLLNPLDVLPDEHETATQPN